MSVGTLLVLYCDHPGCFQTFSSAYVGEDVDKLRVKAAQFNWSHVLKSSMGQPSSDFCPRHGY